MNDATPNTKPTFRRFKSGDTMWDWPDLTRKIFQADRSYKCPTYVHRTPPCQSGCPSGHDIRGWLAIARGIATTDDDRLRARLIETVMCTGAIARSAVPAPIRRCRR